MAKLKLSPSDIAVAVVYIAFLFLIWCFWMVVTSAFLATGTGLIKWGEGWSALMDALGG